MKTKNPHDPKRLPQLSDEDANQFNVIFEEVESAIQLLRQVMRKINRETTGDRSKAAVYWLDRDESNRRLHRWDRLMDATCELHGWLEQFVDAQEVIASYPAS